MNRAWTVIPVVSIALTGAFALTRPGARVNSELEGVGRSAQRGDRVDFHYEAHLTNGRIVDSTFRRRRPRHATLGAGQLISGLESTLLGMRAGGKKEIMIPSRLAYGSRGAAGGIIPPDSDLIYRIEMKRVF